MSLLVEWSTCLAQYAALHDNVINCIVCWFEVRSHCFFIAYDNVDSVELHFVLELFSSRPLGLRGFFRLYLRFSEFLFCTGTLLPRVRLLAHPGIHEGSWTLPRPRRDGNGGSSPSWAAVHQVLSLSFSYSVCQPPGTTYCCRMLFPEPVEESAQSVLLRGPGSAPGQSPRMQSLVSFKATTTVSHWVNVARGSDEVSPGSHLWFARNVELQSSLILRVLTRPPGPSSLRGRKTCLPQDKIIGATIPSEFWRASNPGTGGRRPKNRYSGIPVSIFLNLDLNGCSPEACCSIPCSTDDEYDLVAPVEFCCNAASVGLVGSAPLRLPYVSLPCAVRRVFLCLVPFLLYPAACVSTGYSGAVFSPLF